jgi:hypothetical protein
MITTASLTLADLGLYPEDGAAARPDRAASVRYPQLRPIGNK